MKKVILTLVLMFGVSYIFEQRPFMNQNFAENFKQYEVVDSLPLEYIQLHFNKEIDDERMISLGEGDYMAPVPHPDKMVIKTNKDRSKAIVLYNSYAFGRHLEFDVKENERRIILYYEDNRLYCGYIYDKEWKIAKYFESRKEFKRFIRRPMFNRPFSN